MDYQVRKAGEGDWEAITAIYASARKFMAQAGNPGQWGTNHPDEEQLRQDIAAGELYVLTDGDTIHGVFAFLLRPDPTYGVVYGGDWHADRPYGVLHRVAGDGSGGILHAAVAYAEQFTDCLRIDTHEKNLPMQRSIAREGFQKCGIIHLLNGEPRIAFDRV